MTDCIDKFISNELSKSLSDEISKSISKILSDEISKSISKSIVEMRLSNALNLGGSNYTMEVEAEKAKANPKDNENKETRDKWSAHDEWSTPPPSSAEKWLRDGLDALLSLRAAEAGGRGGALASDEDGSALDDGAYTQAPKDTWFYGNDLTNVKKTTIIRRDLRKREKARKKQKVAEAQAQAQEQSKGEARGWSWQSWTPDEWSTPRRYNKWAADEWTRYYECSRWAPDGWWALGREYW